MIQEFRILAKLIAVSTLFVLFAQENHARSTHRLSLSSFNRNTSISKEKSNQEVNNNRNIDLSHALTHLTRHARDILPQTSISANHTNSICLELARPAVFGLRSDESGKIIRGELTIQANEVTQITLIGQNLHLNFSLALTPIRGQHGDDCTHLDRIKSVLVLTFVTSTIAQVDLNLPSPGSHVPYFMCIRELPDDSQTSMPWCHQGSHNMVLLYVQQDFLPLYMKLVVIFCLLIFSGLFSGLNLGLMALDKNELQVIISCGTEKEKRYARAIEPVRRRGNYLLCSILFSNVLVNSTIAVLLEELTSGIVAVMTSTIFIVMFGEILPQAFCSRHGLAVGAKTVVITYLCMILTAPLSYPVSACLDWALGEEISHAYDRERLMEFIRITRDYNNLETEEVNIISGALKLKRVQLSEIMTRIEDVFMLDINLSLDFETIESVVEQGYSRIPVHETNNKRNILALLFTKDLALLDPDDRTPVQTLISFYNHPIMFMFEDTTLHSALNEFKTGKSHMAFIRRVIDDGDRDPIYEIIGIVTLEDVIEEIIQMEINDETDTVTDNVRRRRRKEAQVRGDFSQFARHQPDSGDSSHNVFITPQLCLAAYQFLSTNVDPFSKRYINDLILKRLLGQKIFHRIRVDSFGELTAQSPKMTTEDDRYLYKAGEQADYFVMILEGRASVTCGSEELNYEAGPFSFFGKSALTTVGIPPELRSRKTSVRPNQVGEKRDSLTTSVDIQRGLSGQLSTSMRKLEQSIQGAPNELELDVIVDRRELTKTGENRISRESMEKYSPFIPDYTVRAVSDVTYLRITREDYISALRATVFENDRSYSLSSCNNESIS